MLRRSRHGRQSRYRQAFGPTPPSCHAERHPADLPIPIRLFDSLHYATASRSGRPKQRLCPRGKYCTHWETGIGVWSPGLEVAWNDRYGSYGQIWSWACGMPRMNYRRYRLHDVCGPLRFPPCFCDKANMQHSRSPHLEIDNARWMCGNACSPVHRS